MPKTNIEDKIQNSSAWRSLQQERHVNEILLQLHWNSVHGSFYSDPEEKKFREIDIVARQSWRRKQNKGIAYCQMCLVIECKSASGYHLQISPIQEPDSRHKHIVWLGEESVYEFNIYEVLQEQSLEDKQIAKIISTFKKKAYPGGAMKGCGSSSIESTANRSWFCLYLPSGVGH